MALLVLGVLFPTLTGCGVIFGGTRENITANSAPDAATITTNPSAGTFTTPASLSLERKHNYTLTFEKEGYRSAEFQINHSIRGGILALDILFTGLLGVIIDAVTGGWFKLEPKTAQVVLTQVDASDAGPDTIEVTISIGESDGGDGSIQIESSVPGVTTHVEKK
jgi:hypothetical protein